MLPAPARTVPAPAGCIVCGAHELRSADVLPPELVAAWNLSVSEARYVNRQQGLHCASCGSTLRCMALATALLRLYREAPPFARFAATERARTLVVLEINEAGGLSPFLARLPGRVLASFPQVDMQSLPYGRRTFDLVVHSDTLEHVASPLAGLVECRRVLRDDGACAFTVPIVVDRLSRSRAGLPPSYHGAPQAADRFLVHTEFGSDVWQLVFRSGFAECRMVALDHPAAHAIVALP